MNSTAMRTLVNTLTAILVAASLSSVAKAASDEGLTSYHENLFAETDKALGTMLEKCNGKGCVFAQSGSDKRCEARYDEIFKKDEVSIHLAFGYLDTEETKSEYYNRSVLLPHQSVDASIDVGLRRQITKPCAGHSVVCGFVEERQPQNFWGKLWGAIPPDVFVKSVSYKGHTVRIKLNVTHASATPFYSMNLDPNGGTELQERFTARAEQNFFGSISESDLTIYTGHARDGGGPDFHPPVLNQEGAPDYKGYYRTKRPGLTSLVSALESSTHRPAIMAILACNSDALFRRSLLAADPQLGLITFTDLSEFSWGIQETFAVLDGFIRQECAETLARTLNTLESPNNARALISNLK